MMCFWHCEVVLIIIMMYLWHYDGTTILREYIIRCHGYYGITQRDKMKAFKEIAAESYQRKLMILPVLN